MKFIWRGTLIILTGLWLGLLLGTAWRWPVSASSAVATPLIAWSTFQGGSQTEYGHAIAVDGSGNVYVTGQGNSTWGTPVLPFNTGNWDAYIAKLDASGNLIWNTFLGGLDWRGDAGLGIAVDGAGSVYVVGYTDGTWGTPVRPFTVGNTDAFVAKLDSNGHLLWNTFLGGTEDDQGNSVALDGNGHIYVGGQSEATWGAPLQSYCLGRDGFVAKLDNNGNLLWNTFLGGDGEDRCTYKIALNVNGEIFTAGSSSNPWGASFMGFTGATDAFAVKLSQTGSLIWNVFLGCIGDDEARALALDDAGNVYVSGLSEATWHTPIAPFSGGTSDGFVAQVDSSGNLLWNTFLGGADRDVADCIAVNHQGGIFVSGFSSATWGAPWREFAGGSSDAFVAALSNTGYLTWNAFLGSSGDSDFGNSLAIDTNSDIYVTGDSSLTWGSPVRPFVASTHDAFAVKISPSPSVAAQTELLKIIQPLLTPRQAQPIMLSIALAQSERVWLGAFDLTGRKVSVILDEVLPAGISPMTWDAPNVGSGTYLLRAKTPTRQGHGKVVIVR